jgi:hypothetical protein
VRAGGAARCVRVRGAHGRAARLALASTELAGTKRARTVLRDALGVPPGPAIHEIHAMLLRADDRGVSRALPAGTKPAGQSGDLRGGRS